MRENTWIWIISLKKNGRIEFAEGHIHSPKKRPSYIPYKGYKYPAKPESIFLYEDKAAVILNPFPGVKLTIDKELDLTLPKR